MLARWGLQVSRFKPSGRLVWRKKAMLVDFREPNDYGRVIPVRIRVVLARVSAAYVNAVLADKMKALKEGRI